MPASPSALETRSPTVPPISESRATASSATTVRKARISANPPKMRGRMPMRDRSRDRFMASSLLLGIGSFWCYPFESGRRPDLGEQFLAEALLEFALQRLQGIDEGLAVDVFDDIHDVLAQLVELVRLVVHFPGLLRADLGGGHDGGLIGGTEGI